MTRPPVISIIIPVYNVEAYLHECLHSILQQTFTDWECILVDDGSPDSSGQICDEYVSNDTRFIVVHKSNGGVSSARNVGIERSRGQWICFVDSDDRLTPDALSYMLQCVENKDADVCLCPIVTERIKSDESIHILSSDEHHELIWACLAYRTDKYFAQGYMIDAPHAKLFRNSIIKQNNIRFIDGLSKSEDAIFDAYFYHFADSIIMSAHQTYYYTINPSSICHTFNWKHIDMLVRVLHEETSFVNRYYPDDSAMHEAIDVRSFTALEQLLYESGTKTLTYSQHIHALKKYISNDIVLQLLKRCDGRNLNKNSYYTLKLAQFKQALLLFLWIKLQQRLFCIRVKAVTTLKHLFGIKETESLRTIFQ